MWSAVVLVRDVGIVSRNADACEQRSNKVVKSFYRCSYLQAAYVDVAGFDDRHKRLSPAVARLRQERLELARWVQRLREGRGDPGVSS